MPVLDIFHIIMVSQKVRNGNTCLCDNCNWKIIKTAQHVYNVEYVYYNKANLFIYLFINERKLPFALQNVISLVGI